MHMDTLICTCQNTQRRWDHQAHCELWDSEDFVSSSLWWDPDTNSLQVAPVDAWNIWADEVGVEIDEEGEQLDEGIDLLDSVLDELVGENLKNKYDEIYDEAAAFVGAETLKLLELLLERPAVLYPYEMELLNSFAEQVHRNVDNKDLPLYDCICFEIGKPTCEECGVTAVEVNNAKHFAPTPSRVLRELKMLLAGETYGCSCSGGSKFLICNTHAVQRYATKAPWTYWNPEAQKLSTVTSTQGNVFDDWGYGGTTTFVGKCRHYGQEVVFPDGTKIWASSSHHRTGTDEHPDFGIYMYDGWPNTVLSYKVNWRDYGLPYLPDSHVLAAADHGLQMAREGKIVEIGCMGGHGRTGTFMAIMLLRAGFDGTADEAIKWVHTNYCKEAIEGGDQEWYIAKIRAWLNGEPIPKKPCTYSDHKKLYEDKKECDCAEWLSDKEKIKKGGVTKYFEPSKWTTLPAPVKNGKTETCSIRRHEILFWRHAECKCDMWKMDIKSFTGSRKNEVKRAKDPLPRADWPKGDQRLDLVAP